MSEFKIESDVPLPATRSAGRAETYPWRKLEIGESFMIPYGDRTPKEASLHASKRAFDAYQRTGRKFSCRRVPEGVRVWRVS